MVARRARSTPLFANGSSGFLEGIELPGDAQGLSRICVFVESGGLKAVRYRQGIERSRFNLRDCRARDDSEAEDGESEIHPGRHYLN